MLEAITTGMEIGTEMGYVVEIGFRPRHPMAHHFEGFIPNKPMGTHNISKCIFLELLGIRKGEDNKYYISDLDIAYVKINGKFINTNHDAPPSYERQMFDRIVDQINKSYARLIKEHLDRILFSNMIQHDDNWSGVAAGIEAAKKAAETNDVVLKVKTTKDFDSDTNTEYDADDYLHSTIGYPTWNR